MTLAELSRTLDDLTAATAVFFVWKTAATMQVELDLPERHRFHGRPFCCCVKQLGREYERRCMRNDGELISRRVLQERVPFIHCCHAGAEELIIPFFIGDQYLGTLFCGPFRRADEPEYPEVRPEYEKLALLTPERTRALARVITATLREIGSLELGPSHLCGLGREAEIDDRIHTALDFMKNHFRRPVGVAEVARCCSLSGSRFLHLFRTETQLGFREWLQRMRTREAVKLLAGTTLRMAEITELCGFSDQSRMAAMIRRYYGCTPTGYRKKFGHRRTS